MMTCGRCGANYIAKGNVPCPYCRNATQNATGDEMVKTVVDTDLYK
jgi:uncharacterized Zn finger protein (UPF0148 family)